jgi:hypothetical protein
MIMAKSSQVMNKSINPSIVKVTLPSHIIPGQFGFNYPSDFREEAF